MNAVVRFPSRQQISKREWIECVSLGRDIQEVEQILAVMKADHEVMRRRIRKALENGASIEDEGRIV